MKMEMMILSEIADYGFFLVFFRALGLKYSNGSFGLDLYYFFSLLTYTLSTLFQPDVTDFCSFRCI